MPSRFLNLRNLRPTLPHRLRHVLKLVPVAGLVGCLYLLSDHLADFQFSDLGLSLGQLTVWQWTCAICLTVLSFLAVGQYDAVIHRVLGTGVAPRRARAAGMRAIAVSQTVGFSSLSGGLVRLRCLPELDLWTISRLSLLVSLSFLASWAVLAGAVVLGGHTGPTALVILFMGLIGWRVALFRPDPTMPGLSPWVGLELLFWTALDTCAAALVLGVLLPAGMMPEFQILFTAFLLSLGAGLLSQSPAGLGAFELSLLVLLPHLDQAHLLAAVLAYRAIYFLIPALIAVALLIRPATIPAPPALQTAAGATRTRALSRAPQADWTLAHQGADIVLSRDQASGWLVRMTRGCLVTLGRPLGQPDLSDLRALAARRGRNPAMYKVDSRTAVLARKSGWQVIQVAQDAVIRLSDWSVHQPACRQLRRKLRAVQDAGIRIDPQPNRLPFLQMAGVARAWAARNGGEKGFSMGQFDPDLLARQHVLLAYLGDELVAFVSFHTGRDNWALDLMRQSDDAPAGTMHALVHAGLVAAGAAGMSQVSLAAVSDWPGPLARFCARLPAMIGLRQFKGSFGPVWEPLYLCSPTRTGLVRAAVSIACAINFGPERSGSGRDQTEIDAAPQQGHEHFRFETATQACDAQGVILRAAAIASLANRPQLTGQTDDQRPFPPA